MEKAIRWMFVVVAAVLVTYSAWSLHSIRAELHQADIYLEKLQQTTQALESENQTLRLTLEQAETKDAFREIIRESSGLVLPENRTIIIGDEN